MFNFKDQLHLKEKNSFLSEKCPFNSAIFNQGIDALYESLRNVKGSFTVPFR